MPLIYREGASLSYICMISALLVSARGACLAPGYLDGALFSPMGTTGFSMGLASAVGGCVGACGAALVPQQLAELVPHVPSAAPLHVLGLLGAGFFDFSADRPGAVSPLLSALVLLLGGLWSRRLGPHREIWSWDVVEIAAVDLLGAEVFADHLWQRRPCPTGALWGGGEVRLFRLGLAASHHHLSAAGVRSLAAYSSGIDKLTLSAGSSFALWYWPPKHEQTHPLRVQPLLGCRGAGGLLPVAGEASLVAWSAAIVAPSSGAIAAWGLWGGPLYLWLCLVPLLIFVSRPLVASRSLFWVHYPLFPLSHALAAPLPWAPLMACGAAGVSRKGG